MKLMYRVWPRRWSEWRGGEQDGEMKPLQWVAWMAGWAGGRLTCWKPRVLMEWLRLAGGRSSAAEDDD